VASEPPRLHLLSALLVLGCGGKSIQELSNEGVHDTGGVAGQAQGSGGTPITVGTGGAGQAGSSNDGSTPAGIGGGGGPITTGGAGGTGTTPAGYPRCGVLDPERADDCEGIEKILPFDPDVSLSTDGSIQIGESAPVSVWVRNGDDIDHDNACVGVVVDTPGINLEAEFDDTNPTRIGSMAPGFTPIITPAYFYVRSAEPGTVARFTTWTTFEGTDCVGPTATVEALVKEYPF
jgi:hypothetical protein